MSGPDDEDDRDARDEPEERDDSPLTAEQQALVRKADGLVESRVAWHLSRVPAAMHIADDLVGAAKRALTEASRRYSARFGATFTSFARYAIDGAILDEIAREARQHTLQSASTACLRFGALAHPVSKDEELDPMADDEVSAAVKLRRALRAKALGAALALALQMEELWADQVDPEGAAAFRRLAEALQGVLARLSARDQEMLRCLYAGGMDLGAVAEKLGLAYPTVKVRHAKLLAKLREDLEAAGFSSALGGE